jgi:hypothetical protein
MATKITALEKAAELINAGETIKAKLKDAMESLNREYSKLHDKCHDAQITFANADFVLKDGGEARGKFFRDNDLPFDLHQVRPEKHKPIFVRWMSEDAWNEVQTLIDTREALKALPVVTKAPKEKSVEEIVKTRVLSTFKSQAENHKAQFNWAKAIIEEMNKELPEIKSMPVSVSHVYCSNYHGTSWLRVDWFFNGHKVAFNVIAAAVDAARAGKELANK